MAIKGEEPKRKRLKSAKARSGVSREAQRSEDGEQKHHGGKGRKCAKSLVKVNIFEGRKVKKSTGSRWCWERAARRELHLYHTQSQELEGAFIPVTFFVWVITAGTWGSLLVWLIRYRLGEGDEGCHGLIRGLIWHQPPVDPVSGQGILKERTAAHQ